MQLGAVLMYHRIGVFDSDRYQLCTPPERLRAQLHAVTERYPVVALRELRQKAPAIALTFDDGTVDALAAAQILDELRLPATFFVTTCELDTPHEHWWDTVERMSLPESLRELLLDADEPERRALFGRYLPQLPQPRESHRCLVASEVRALAERHTIGGHGHAHLRVPSLSAEAIRHELGFCKQTLESLLGRPILELAYPYGAVSDEAVNIARDLGYTSAVTVEERAVQSGDDPLRWPRLDAQKLEAGELVQRLNRLFESDQKSV